MEIRSEPTYVDVQVNCLDVAFPGDLQSYALRTTEAQITQDADTITISFTAGGTVVFQLKYAHWIARRVTTIRVLAPEATKPESV